MRNRLLIFLTSQSCCLTDTSDKSSKSPWSQMDLLPPLMQAELVQLFLVSRTEISSQFKKQKLIESAICVIKEAAFVTKEQKLRQQKINVFSLDERKRCETRLHWPPQDLVACLRAVERPKSANVWSRSFMDFLR